MKTVKQLADELQVTPQGVYKKIKQLDKQLNNCLYKGSKGETLVNEVGEWIIKNSFKQFKPNAVEENSKQPDNNSTDSLDSLKYKEYLETRVKALEEELIKEREHNRELDRKLFEIVRNMNEITKNNQILLKGELDKTVKQIALDEEPTKKKSFFERLFNR